MPVRTQKKGNKYVVVDDKGKVFGTHASKKQANDQTTAVNIATGYVPGVKPRKKAKK